MPPMGKVLSTSCHRLVCSLLGLSVAQATGVPDNRRTQVVAGWAMVSIWYSMGGVLTMWWMLPSKPISRVVHADAFPPRVQ